MKQVAIGTLGYTVVTFVLAVVWHAVIVEGQYRAFGYIEGEPNFALGFTTILIQGLVLSILYPFVSFKGGSVQSGLRFSLFIGVFFWTSHVLAFVAKQTVNQVPLFIVMESFYVLLQFGAFGVLIGLIYHKALSQTA